jgi:cyclopropane fatty-acyl-phospholipid synthase-like methyltransferase
MGSDPEMAVGEFDGMGRKQLQYLQSQGMNPENTLLEIGCGIFRAGEHFISYLDAGNYYALEISEETIQTGFERLDQEIVDSKQPQVFNNDDLQFSEIDQEVDYIIAHSVFTHTPTDVVKECFENLSKVMDEGTVFYFTFFDETADFGVFEPGGFKYTSEKIDRLSAQNGLRFDTPSNTYCPEERQVLGRIVLEDNNR